MSQTTDFLENYVHEGVELEIFTYPAPILKKIADPVIEFDENLKELAKNMLYTMYEAPGIGLAAPQVGKSIRMFVMDIDYARDEVTTPDGKDEIRLSKFNPQVFINPIFKNKNGEILYEEGCLSVPGVYEQVKRSNEITVEFHDLNGEKKTLEAEGVLSVCIQHENDHLDGVVFLERLSMLKKQLLTKKYLKKRKNN